MTARAIWPLFWALITVFVFILCLFFIPPLRGLLAGSELFLAPFAVFFLLGVALLVLTLKEKAEGLLKVFFLLTAASAVGIFVFVLLHNLVYGLFIHFFGEGFWDGIGGDEPFFFILAIFVCPLGFLTGAVGTIVLRIRQARSR